MDGKEKKAVPSGQEIEELVERMERSIKKSFKANRGALEYLSRR